MADYATDRKEVLKILDDSKFHAFYKACWNGKPPALHGRKILTLDPGETTGYTKFDGSSMTIELGQLDTISVEEGFDALVGIAVDFQPDHVRCEDYKVYEWKADSHAWGSNHTSQFIGAVKILCHQKQIPLSFCMAQHAKMFWTDDKLKLCGLYSRGMKHARDAERHLLYYLCYPDKVHKES